MNEIVFWIGIAGLTIVLNFIALWIFRPSKFGTLHVTLKDDKKFVYAIDLEDQFDKIIFKNWASLKIVVHDERSSK